LAPRISGIWAGALNGALNAGGTLTKESSQITKLTEALTGMTTVQKASALAAAGFDKAASANILSLMGLENAEINAALGAVGYSAAAKGAGLASLNLGKVMDGLKIAFAANPVGMTVMAVGTTIAVLGPLVDHFAKASERIIEAAEEAAEKIDSMRKSLSDGKSLIDEVGEDYERLAKGVSNSGKIISLSAEDYQKYNDIVTRIAETFPSMIAGHTSEGVAILKHKGSVEELTKAYEDEVQALRDLTLLDAGKIFAGFDKKIKDDRLFGFLGSQKAILPQIDMIKEILDERNLDSLKAPKYQHGVDITGSKRAVYNVAGFKDLLKPIYEAVDSDADWGTIENLLLAKLRELNAKVETELTGRRSIAGAYLENAFGNMGESAPSNEIQEMIGDIFRSLDADFYKDFDSEIQMQAWIQKNILDPLKDPALANNLSDGLRTLTYDGFKNFASGNQSKIADNFLSFFPQEIYGYFERNGFKIPVNLEPVMNSEKLAMEAARAIHNAPELHLSQSEYQEVVSMAEELKALSSDDLVILASLEYDEDSVKTVAELLEMLAELRNAQAEAAESAKKADMAEIFANTKKQVDLLNKALKEQGTYGIISKETASAMRDSGEGFSEMLNIVNGGFSVDEAAINSFIESLIQTAAQTLLAKDATEEQVRALTNLLPAIDAARTAAEHFSEMQSAFGSLDKAVEEYNAGGAVTVDTFMSLIAMSSEYLSLLEVENGQILINAENRNAMVEALRAEALASLQASASEDMLAYAQGREEDMSSTAKTAVARLGDATEKTGNQAAEAGVKIMGAAVSTYNFLRASGGFRPDKKLGDIKAGLDAIGDSYVDAWEKLSSLKIDVGSIGGGSKSGGSSGASAAAEKEVEEYLAKIDKLHEAKKNLDSVQDDLTDLNRDLGMTDDLNEQLEILKQITAEYENEEAAMKRLASERDALILENIAKLESQGFEIEYDSSSGEMFVKNLEHINELTGDTQEKTNEIRKEYETMIGDTQKLADENAEIFNNIADIPKKLKDNAQQAFQTEYSKYNDRSTYNLYSKETPLENYRELYDKEREFLRKSFADRIITQEDYVSKMSSLFDKQLAQYSDIDTLNLFGGEHLTNERQLLESELDFITKAYHKGEIAFEKYASESKRVRDLLFADNIADKMFDVSRMEDNGTAKRIIIENLREIAEEYKSEMFKIGDSANEAWQSAYDSFKGVEDQIQDLLDSIVEDANAAVDSLQGLSDTLKTAAEQYSRDGFISVDTFQDIASMGIEYLGYLKDENGLLIINKERIEAATKAKMKDLAVETARNYVLAIGEAKDEGNVKELKKLIFATDEATDSTWRLIKAQLASYNLAPEQYAAAIDKLNKLKALGESAGESIGKLTLDEKMESWNDYVDGVVAILEKEKEALEKQRKLYEEQKSNYETAVSTVTGFIDEQIEALQKENEELDKQFQTQKAIEDLEKARGQKTQQVYVEGQGFVWQEDMKAVSGAQEKLDEMNRKDSQEAEIEALQNLKKAWQDAADSYQKAKDAEITAAILGANWESDIFDKREDRIEAFKDGYSRISGQLDEKVKGSVAYQILKTEELIKEWEDALSAATKDRTKYENVLTGVENFEKANYSARLDMLKKFVSDSTSELEDLRQKHADVVAEISSSGESGVPYPYLPASDSYIPSFASGGVVDYTGLAKTHGGPGYGAEMVLSNADSAKLFNLIHNSPDLIRSLFGNIGGSSEADKIRDNLSGGRAFNGANSSGGERPVNVNIGNISLPNVTDSDGFAREISNSLRNIMTQKIYAR
jgi:hypothetical protein